MKQLGNSSTLSVGFVSSPDPMSGTSPARGDLLQDLRHQSISVPFVRPYHVFVTAVHP